LYYHHPFWTWMKKYEKVYMADEVDKQIFRKGQATAHFQRNFC